MPSTALRHFEHDQRGTTAPIFGIAFAGIFLLVAMAVDFGVASNEKLRQQAALDAAMLAAAEKVGLEEQVGIDMANSVYAANTRADTRGALKDLRLDAQTGAASAKGEGWSLTSLLRGINVPSLDIGTSSRAVRGSNPVEVVLVLDNSSELAGAPLEALKSAARRLVSVVYGNAAGSGTARMGVVPFAGAVNVGPGYANAAWIDRTGLSPIHFENFDQQINRFDMFARMSTSWGGCVEVRPVPHDVSDSPANPQDGASLFVPMFAPDEPDVANAAGDEFVNSYLQDNGGACTPVAPVCTNYNSRNGKCTSWEVPAIPAEQAQRQTCKYQGASVVSGAVAPTSKGPNFLCDSQPVTPMTNQRTTVDAAIDAMRAAGGSNVAEGVMWGWRVISPGEPFPEGLPYDHPTNRKYMIIMARGGNFHEGLRSFNKSWYSAWGFGPSTRLNPSSFTTTALTNSMNETTRAACRAVSDAGIKVYTIGFGTSDAHTRSMLQYCATRPHDNFEANSPQELLSVFETIGQDIVKVRVSG